ncbi:NAD(+)/NADH kinase [Schaalia sp. 19OD2882]|uniref:diacylglycerol/lipid kinase family protein n=1 Tax=Schaalia sp. 19OD2882 TaxID=2794089 RepID=UPI001C1ED77B|nr:diacylglycerol kinase family protein [Schaalia sp. 19OD2882]QWW19500.1 NAD(+)/NADH kinase [Schaalia sp. 19OD2882]
MTSNRWMWAAGAFGAVASTIAGAWWALHLRSQRETIRQALLEPARADHPDRGVPRPWVIVNPSKFDGPEDFADFRRHMEAAAREVGVHHIHWRETTVEDPGTGQARKAIDEGASIVIAAGGDGTVRAVAAALAGTGVRMGVLPNGTGNLFARNVGIPVDDHDKALRIALGAGHRSVDLGWLRVDNAPDEHAFLVIAGIGFDGRTMADTDSNLKKSMGWAAYVVAAMGALEEERMSARLVLRGARDVGEQRALDWSALDDGQAGVISGASAVDRDAEAGSADEAGSAGASGHGASADTAGEGGAGDEGADRAEGADRSGGTKGAGEGADPDEGEVAELKARSVLFANCGQLPLVTLAPDASIDDGYLDIIAADTQVGAVGWVNLAGKIFAQGLGLKTLNLPWSASHLAFRQTRSVRVTVDMAQEVQVDGDALGEARTVHARIHEGALDVSVPEV